MGAYVAHLAHRHGHGIDRVVTQARREAFGDSRGGTVSGGVGNEHDHVASLPWAGTGAGLLPILAPPAATGSPPRRTQQARPAARASGQERLAEDLARRGAGEHREDRRADGCGPQVEQVALGQPALHRQELAHRVGLVGDEDQPARARRPRCRAGRRRSTGRRRNRSCGALAWARRRCAASSTTWNPRSSTAARSGASSSPPPVTGAPVDRRRPMAFSRDGGRPGPTRRGPSRSGARRRRTHRAARPARRPRSTAGRRRGRRRPAARCRRPARTGCASAPPGPRGARGTRAAPSARSPAR